jgi:hypothetical protein
MDGENKDGAGVRAPADWRREFSQNALLWTRYYTISPKKLKNDSKSSLKSLKGRKSLKKSVKSPLGRTALLNCWLRLR